MTPTMITNPILALRLEDGQNVRLPSYAVDTATPESEPEAPPARICAAPACCQPIPTGSSKTRRFCSQACRYATTKPSMAARPRSTWPPARLQDRLAEAEHASEVADADALPRLNRQIHNLTAELEHAKRQAMAEAPA
jgi:hypothetical protein